MSKTFAILVGGGPAPGINGVISAASLEAIRRGHRVFGVYKGFERLMAGDANCIRELSYQDVVWIAKEGGSILETSRANPKKSKEFLKTTVSVLKEKGVDYLITIGGDDTASSAQAISNEAKGSIAVGHVPKTIDNDLPLPELTSTFGFQSAREVGCEIAETLMVDAKTTNRWYLITAMGRKAGHLALGIGLASGAPLTIIPEEFAADKMLPLETIVDIIVGSIIKRRSEGQTHGVAILAEGLAERLDPTSSKELQNCELDPHGHIRFAELDFGGMMRRATRAKLEELGLKDVMVVDKNVGYELRCRPPISFDREYTRALGYAVVDFLLEGKSAFMAARIRNQLRAIDFKDFIDAKTSVSSVRLVDTSSSRYLIARNYQDRLEMPEAQKLLKTLK